MNKLFIFLLFMTTTEVRKMRQNKCEIAIKGTIESEALEILNMKHQMENFRRGRISFYIKYFEANNPHPKKGGSYICNPILSCK